MSQYSDYSEWSARHPDPEPYVEPAPIQDASTWNPDTFQYMQPAKSEYWTPPPTPYDPYGYVTAPLYSYAQQYANQVGATQDQLDEILGDYGNFHAQQFGGWSDQDSAAPAALAWSAFAMNGAENGINPSDLELLQKSTHEDPAWMSQLNNAIAYGNQKAAANHNSGGFGDLLGPLAMMAGMYFLGPAAGALGEVGGATAMELAAADAAAGIGAFGEAFPAAITADIGAATAGNMGYDAAANLGEQAFQGPSLWDSAKGLYNQAKPALDAFGNIKKGVNLAQQLIGTGDAKNMNQSVSGLKQYQTQSQQGAPSRAFGLNNYNSVRG